MEQSYSDNWGNGWADCKQRRTDQITRRGDLQWSHSGGLWAQVVRIRTAASEWWQRQRGTHMGPFRGLLKLHHAVASQA